MRITLSRIALLLYIVPTILAVVVVPGLGYKFTDEAVFTMLLSVFFCALGYWYASTIPYFHSYVEEDVEKSAFIISYGIMGTGLIAILADLSLVGSVPLLQGGAGRITLQESVLWNIFVLGTFGVFYYSRTSYRLGQRRLGHALTFVYLLVALLTAWKGTFVLVLFMWIFPRYKNYSLPVSKTVITGAVLILMFFVVNGLRGNSSISEVSNQIIYYAVWGYVNFDYEAIGYWSYCVHSVPVVGCPFEIDNRYLLIPTWNTYTALAPLYVDGGKALIAATFFMVAFALRRNEFGKSTLLNDYLFFFFCYFFILAHNGYAFYSNSFFAIILSLLIRSILTQRLRIRAGGR